jgi:glutathione synthase/RimK-type ligase-like ATP-grasp enzyme
VKRVAILTSAALPKLSDDDRAVLAPLAALGIEGVPLVWDDASPEKLEAFAGVLLRSPWDWYRRTREFRAFLERLALLRTPVWNPAPMLLTFCDKTYFEPLLARGLPLVPTRWLTVAELDSLPSLARAMDSLEVVVKPSFSANAFNTHRFVPAEAPLVAERLAHLPPEAELMVQPFLPEVREGEWSCVFFDGVFSHSVKKRPKAGDFRVQAEHGGVSFAEPAPEVVQRTATLVLEAAAPGALYARVDGVLHEGRFLVMELELVEPELFFRFHPEAPARFARALAARLG